ncbi:MAG: hypothetical protein ACRD5E_12490 [Nitrososphaeraceae archaeon]
MNRQTYWSHGLQDTVVIPGHGKVIIRIPFDDFGKSVHHCRSMFHGDGDKMGGVEELNCIFVHRDHRPNLVLIQTHLGNTIVNFGLLVVDMQNGFVSRGGSYDRLGMNIQNYRQVIPSIQELISFVENRAYQYSILRQYANLAELIY